MSSIARKIYRTLLPHETRHWLYKLRHQEEYEALRSEVHPSPKGDFSLRPFDEYECIFIHITKSAGTSVATSLFGYLPYHYTAMDYRVIYGRNTFDRYFKFAFVRNPWDRLYSAYRYLKAGGWDDDDRRWSLAHLARFDDFTAFVGEWVCKENIDSHMHFWPQHRFICDRNRKLLVNYLAYFETLESDFRNICKRIGIQRKIGRHNANPGMDYRDAYDDSSRDIVSKVYATDIRLFGYSFDGIQGRTVPAGKTRNGTGQEP